MYELALKIATEAHEGQKRWNGDPYITHPIRVADSLEGPIEKIVAILHDTIEDTDVTANFLLKQGFNQEIIDAVVALTRIENETYREFIERIAKNDIACFVKIADIEDNLIDMGPSHGLFYRYHQGLVYLLHTKVEKLWAIVDGIADDWGDGVIQGFGDFWNDVKDRLGEEYCKKAIERANKREKDK